MIQVAFIDDNEQIAKSYAEKVDFYSEGQIKTIVIDNSFSFEAKFDQLLKSDYIFVDYHFEDGFDGIALARELRNGGYKKDIYLLTGDGSINVKAKASLSNVVFLNKGNFSLKELTNQILTGRIILAENS